MIQEVVALPPDSIRAVVRDVFTATSYDWHERTTPFSFLVDLVNRVVDWLESVREFHPGVYWLILGLLTGLLLAVIVHVCVLIWLALKPRALASAVPGRAVVRQHDERWHLEESQRLRAAGRFPEALAHRFTGLILQLEERKALRFDPAKTPREYADEAQLDDAGLSVLNRLVASLYRHLFGGEVCTVEDLDRFDLEARELGGWLAA